MTTSKKNNDKITQYLGRLFRDLPDRYVTTEKELFKWLYEYLESSDEPYFMSSHVVRWVDQVKAEILSDSAVLSQKVLPKSSCQIKQSNKSARTINPLLFIALNDAYLNLEKFYGDNRIPVSAIRLLAILVMIARGRKLFRGLKYSHAERCIEGAADFERRHRLQVFVDVPQSPEAEAAIEAFQRYKREQW